MRLGLLTSVFADRPLDAALDAAVRAGISTVELGCGNYPGDAHCRPDELLADRAALARFRRQFEERGMTISALACHGNPLHPNSELAAAHHGVFESTVRLAGELDLDRVTLFSGCPGDPEGGRHPNWVTCAWPSEYGELLEWQWQERVIPYWSEQAAFASGQGVRRLCFEMHPGFVVYHPQSLRRLRVAVGDSIGANFDPSHLVWQGIDVVEAIRDLGRDGAIFHVHAKDVAFNDSHVRHRGVLDTTPLDDVSGRAWVFRTVGYGHDELFWRRFVSALREVGYDDVVSIEHEDALAAPDEGVRKAAELLLGCLLVDPPATPWWTS